jgi:hypothetical protein
MHLEAVSSAATPSMGPKNEAAENYGHAEIDAKIPGELMPGWGCGSAAGSAALAQARWGGLYLDVGRAAFGIDGCRDARRSGGRADLALGMLRHPARPAAHREGIRRYSGTLRAARQQNRSRNARPRGLERVSR